MQRRMGLIQAEVQAGRSGAITAIQLPRNGAGAIQHACRAPRPLPSTAPSTTSPCTRQAPPVVQPAMQACQQRAALAAPQQQQVQQRRPATAAGAGAARLAAPSSSASSSRSSRAATRCVAGLGRLAHWKMQDGGLCCLGWRCCAAPLPAVPPNLLPLSYLAPACFPALGLPLQAPTRVRTAGA